MSDFFPDTVDDDPRSRKARELLDSDATAAIVYKSTRAGATTSLCSEIMKRDERFAIIEPTNRINADTLERATEISGTGKQIIPILANTDCMLNKAMLLKYPEVRALGVIPLQRCADGETGKHCRFYDVCPITRPLRHVLNIGGYGITYHKLIALNLSQGEIASQILHTILSVDHIIFDEAHELGYPSVVAVRIHPEIDVSMFKDLNLPILPGVVGVFEEILKSSEPVVAQIKTSTPEYFKTHLAFPITSAGAITKTGDIAAGITELIHLMIHRDEYGLNIDDVVLLKDMLLLCTDRDHIVHGIISTKTDGSKRLLVFVEGTDSIYRSIVRRTMARMTDQRRIDGGLVSRLWNTSGTIANMNGVLPLETTSILFGDPMDTNAMFAVVADTYRISDKGLRNKKSFERVLNDIKQIVNRFGADKCALIVMNKRWFDKIEPELEGYQELEITWYNSDATVGVESDRRIWIAVGMAEKPKNAMDAVALSRTDDDLVVVSDVLRVERVHIDTHQAWSRAKDPDANVRSVVVALGCNMEDVRHVVTWRINRKLEVNRVKKANFGSRIHYDVVGDELIGSEVQIIERGKNNNINELIENWLLKGDTTPLTCKMFEDFFEKHKDEKMTIRDIHQKLNLARRGLTEKDVEQFLSESVNPVVKNTYIYSLGKNDNGVVKNTYESSVIKNTYESSPLSKNDILQHYRHPLVTASTLRHSTMGSSWRCGIVVGDGYTIWNKRIDTKSDKLEKLHDLTDITDYHLLIEKGRTIYWSLNYFEASIRTQHRIKGSGAILGEYKTTTAYSLGVDIDTAKGVDVFTGREALEAAAAFYISKLKDISIHHSYDVLFSGGGLYILIHPEITICPVDTRMDRERWFYLLAETYNIFINDVQAAFFEAHPEYALMVKFDALNNSKRVFKTIFSIHKKYPFACIPLDKNNPRIDFDRAHPPLSDDVLKSGIDWLSDYDIKEQQALVGAMQQYQGRIKEKRSVDHTDIEVSISDTAVSIEDFPPCINRLLAIQYPPAGETRMIGFLSAFLGQMGWNEESALKLVEKVANQFSMDENNAKNKFYDWFCKMHCPGCDKIRHTGTQYPSMFMGELGLCKPDEHCDNWVYNPIDYKQSAKKTEVEI